MPTRIVEGRRAPDFSLEDAGGKRVSPADFKGKDVIVYFYPKDDTPGSAPTATSASTGRAWPTLPSTPPRCSSRFAARSREESSCAGAPLFPYAG